MRLAKEIIDKGTFSFFKNDERFDCLGTLTIVDGGKANVILEVEDIARISVDIGENFSIFADLKENNYCAFLNCFINSQPIFGKGEVKITIHESLLNIDVSFMHEMVEQYQENNKIALNGIQFSFDNITEWAKDFKLFEQIVDDEARTITISCNRREKITLYQNDELKISVNFAYQATGNPLGSSVGEAKIVERPYINIEGITKKDFELSELFSKVYEIMAFLYIAVGVPISIKEAKAIFYSQERRTLADMFFSSSPFLSSINTVKYLDINIPLVELNRLNSEFFIIRNWFEFFNDFLPSISLYLTYKTTPNIVTDIKFLWLAQAVEAFHRRRKTGEKIPQEEYERMSNKLLELCADEPKEYLEWLKGKIQYGNETNFRSRIKELLTDVDSKLSMEIEKSMSISKISNAIVGYRNQFTHHDKSNKELNLSMALQLSTYTNLLELILIFHLLQEIGIPDNNLKNLFDRGHKKIANIVPTVKYQFEHYINKDKDPKKA